MRFRFLISLSLIVAPILTYAALNINDGCLDLRCMQQSYITCDNQEGCQNNNPGNNSGNNSDHHPSSNQFNDQSSHQHSKEHVAPTDNTTPEYHEIIEMYEALDEQYPSAKLVEIGASDIGKPIHLFIISKDKIFDAEQAAKSEKTIFFINNGIHPGECNGIDASIAFASDLLSGKTSQQILDNSIILIVPVFNIGGALNRSPYHRANQNGPIEHGFRGNARNLDLNRDFVKMDSKNARTLAKCISEWDPHVFADTHSTNGADYPYTVTLISGHPNQLREPLSSFLKNTMEPALYKAMNESDYKMCPYVNSIGRNPENGIAGFFEYPRYLAGYTTYFNILSFTIETHMLKPYPERVASTKYLLEQLSAFIYKHSRELLQHKKEATERAKAQKKHVLIWKNDTARYDMINFTGYTARYEHSNLTGQKRLVYDRGAEWTDKIPYYNYFNPEVVVEAPKYYVIPQAWSEIIERLSCSAIEMSRFEEDCELEAEVYYIKNYSNYKQPYNGRYPHYGTTVKQASEKIKIYEGDYLIPVEQGGAAFLVHCLEPEAYDSFFNWNFIDAILSRKEYFSPYLFEENAQETLDENPALKKEFLLKKKTDADFAGNSYAQLRWIYERSKWSEPTYLRYPVYRLNQ